MSTVFLAIVAKALLVGLYGLVTGRDLFSANPKGPLYRWFGKPTHCPSPVPPAIQPQRLLPAPKP